MAPEQPPGQQHARDPEHDSDDDNDTYDRLYGLYAGMDECEGPAELIHDGGERLSGRDQSAHGVGCRNPGYRYRKCSEVEDYDDDRVGTVGEGRPGDGRPEHDGGNHNELPPRALLGGSEQRAQAGEGEDDGRDAG
jgi:hypothetical protein